MLEQAKWISNGLPGTGNLPCFVKDFQLSDVKKITKATLEITTLGVYEVFLNGTRIGDFIFAPGWTDYNKRLQVQTYEVQSLLQAGSNRLEVAVGPGWYANWMRAQKNDATLLLLASLKMENNIGQTITTISTDETWKWHLNTVLSSSIYMGEVQDLRINDLELKAVQLENHEKTMLMEQVGEKICEQETFAPKTIFKTVNGDVILDFGQNLTGYVACQIQGKSGQTLKLTHAEILLNGEIYTENYRSCPSTFSATLKDGPQQIKPHFTFYGYRYVKVELSEADGTKVHWMPQPSDFRSIAVYSQLTQTGFFQCGHEKLNQLFSNICWGQRCNFLDVPTDCPQRDERLGWTGDIQVFSKTAAYLFDVEQFFKKWLGELRSAQFDNGCIPKIVPNVFYKEDGQIHQDESDGSSAWGDAACVCPWNIYLAYGNKEQLQTQFESMKKWVEYIHGQDQNDHGLWVARTSHFGDWLGLDAKPGSYEGSTDKTLIATAMYAYSTQIVIAAGKVLGEDVSVYEKRLQETKVGFRETFVENDVLKNPTQTGYALAICFDIMPDMETAGNALVDLLHQSNDHLTTGFVGTPHLLHALSKTNHYDMAYKLLLREDYPSWLYEVNMGATTMWEHWDGLKEDGTVWSSDMNSFNHYAYGAVADWIFSVAAGIQPDASAPGYQKVRIAPHPDERLKYLNVRLQTRYGEISVSWKYVNGEVKYDIIVPETIDAEIKI